MAASCWTDTFLFLRFPGRDEARREGLRMQL
jgi:hypothetical protein